MEFNKNLETLKNSIEGLKEIKDDIRIVIVSNVKNITKNFKDYDSHSVITEYFSEEELNDILRAFREFGFYVEVFFDEMDFIKYYLDGDYFKTNKKYTVLYDTSQKGIGPGRKSLIPAFAQINSLMIINSDPYVVGLVRHRYHYHCILKHLGLPSAPSWLFSIDGEWLNNDKPLIGEKVIAKLTYECASIGLNKDSVFFYDNSKDSYLKELSQKYMQPITVQKFIAGYEIEVPFINFEKIMTFFPVGLSVNNNENIGDYFLHYDLVYDDSYDFYKYENSVSNDLMEISKNVGEIINIKDIGRIDFRIDNQNNYYITDVSSHPHLTPHGSVAYMFKELGLSYSEQMALLIASCLRRYKVI